jgi:hypothetical protein
MPPRIVTALRCRSAADFLDELEAHGAREVGVIGGGDDEGARPADNVLAIVAHKVRLLIGHRESVDRDSHADRAIARPVGAGAPVGCTVAGNVYDAPAGRIGVGQEFRRGESERPIDGGFPEDDSAGC